MNAEPRHIEQYRDTTRKLTVYGYTFRCSRCKERRELAGWKLINGKKVCRYCQEEKLLPSQ